MKFISAISFAESTSTAIGEVLDQIGDIDTPVDLAAVFATVEHRDQLDEVRRRLDKAVQPRVLIGSSAEGVLACDVERDGGRAGLAVLLGQLPGVTLSPFSYDDVDWEAALQSPETLRDVLHIPESNLRAVLMLADPFSVPMVHLLPLLSDAFPRVPIMGGMASGAEAANENRLLLDDRVFCGGGVGLAIAGHVAVDCTVSQGCRPIGRSYVITRSRQHLVQELGGQPILSVIDQVVDQLDAEDQALVQRNGLLVGRVIDEYKDRFGRGDFLIKNIIGADREQGFVGIGDAQIRVGQTIQFHIRDQKTAEEDFMLLLEGQQLHGAAAGGLLFSCNGRGTRLFDRENADVEMVRRALGDIPLAGFFAAGEIGPVGHASFLHGHTASLMVFRPTALSPE